MPIKSVVGILDYLNSRLTWNALQVINVVFNEKQMHITEKVKLQNRIRVESKTKLTFGNPANSAAQGIEEDRLWVNLSKNIYI